MFRREVGGQRWCAQILSARPARRIYSIFTGTALFDLYNIANQARGRMNKKPGFESMTVDELWLLHEELNQVLSVRLTSEKRELEKRLAQLQRENKSRTTENLIATSAPRERRHYPRVLPKYRNPNEPSETWSGRGKTPRWLTAALKTGHTIDEFAIRDAEANKGTSRRRGA